MTADQVEIRRATAADLSAILAIEQQSPSASHWTKAEYERILSAQLCLVGETGNRIAGFLCAKQAAGEWELENIAVARALQRRGVAGELLKLLLNHVRQSGASIVFLEVRESNIPARRFYEKQGFAELGRRRKYYRSPDEDALVYRLDLNRSEVARAQSRKPKA